VLAVAFGPWCQLGDDNFVTLETAKKVLLSRQNADRNRLRNTHLQKKHQKQPSAQLTPNSDPYRSPEHQAIA